MHILAKIAVGNKHTMRVRRNNIFYGKVFKEINY